MTLDQFNLRTGLLAKSELEKVALFAYYYLQVEGLKEFSVTAVLEWFAVSNLGRPNSSRLKTRIGSSRDFVRGSIAGTFKLHARTIARLQEELPFLSGNSEEIVFTSSILPETVFKGTRDYIERLAKQINASYDHRLYDACAVIMRRLLEVLLIHSYQAHAIENQIQDASGDYKDLKAIIGDAVTNKKLALSKGAKGCLDTFRVLGNFSAHKIMYTCRKPDISNVALDYRAAIEELVYKAGFRS